MYVDFLDLSQPLYLTIDELLTPDECRGYILRFERSVAEVGTVIGVEGELVDLAVRNNTRVMWDGAEEAERLFERIVNRVPPVLRGMSAVGLNHRLRLYRYAPGERHGAHWDTEVELPGGRRTLLTFVVYLNDGFSGGRTEFPELGASIQPRTGRALMFQHRVVHIAEEVSSGIKYVLRSDVVYGDPP